MSNDSSNSKPPARESFWTAAFRIEYLAFCREVDQENLDIYTETLARLHIRDGNQRGSDEGSTSTQYPLPDTGKPNGEALPLPSVGKERIKTPPPTASQDEDRPKMEATREGKLDLKSAAEYYGEEATDELSVETRKQHRSSQQHEKMGREGCQGTQALPLKMNAGQGSKVKDGKLDLKSSAEYYKDSKTKPEFSQQALRTRALKSVFLGCF